MTDKKHAKFSASASFRWLACPASIQATEEVPPHKRGKSSAFAEEGTIAHEVADLCLQNNFRPASYYEGKSLKEIAPEMKLQNYSNKFMIPEEMCEFVQDYVNYVSSHMSKDSVLFAEERVDYSHIVPEGFGTVDATVVDVVRNTLHVFDLKYGMGLKVDAMDNSQAQLYALGMMAECEAFWDIDKVVIHIVQPRLGHFDHWETTPRDLIAFGHYCTERADLALSDNPPYNPGEKQCKWCLAKTDCKALNEQVNEVMLPLFEDLDAKTLPFSEKKAILDNAKLIREYITAVEEEVYGILNSGGQFQGYKIVTGKPRRKWRKDIEHKLYSVIGDKAFKRSLIGVVQAEKLLGKEEIKQYVEIQDGKPVLAPESDKRKAVTVEGFEDLDS